MSGSLGATFSQVMFGIIAFSLNVVGQSVAICATTILQEETGDAYRGRVFALYDMMSNATFVAGAAVSALFMPVTGKSYWIIGAVAVGFLLASAGYLAAAGQLPGVGRPGPASPSASPQRSSS